MFMVGDRGVAHYLFSDTAAARVTLEAAGVEVGDRRETLVRRLDQGTPGELGMIARRMSEAGVNIEVIYSNHDNQLILVVDDLETGAEVSRSWAAARGRAHRGFFGATPETRRPAPGDPNTAP